METGWKIATRVLERGPRNWREVHKKPNASVVYVGLQAVIDRPR